MQVLAGSVITDAVEERRERVEYFPLRGSVLAHRTERGEISRLL